LSAAFDLIAERIAGSGGGDGAAPRASETAAGSAFPAPSVEMTVVEMPAAASQTVQAETATDPAEAAISAPATQAEVIAAPAEVADAATVASEVAAEVAEIAAEATDVAAEVAQITAEAADVAAEVAEITAEAADADDEALLEMVALAMAAPDPFDGDEPSDADPDDIDAAAPPPADPIIVAREAEPEAAPAQPLAIQPSLQPSFEPSLGSSLIANGIVRRPNGAAADPLAPLRRLSQVEKIALFS
jgi:hypothetical protein